MDAFTIKLDAAGSLVWAHPITASYPQTLVLGQSGVVYLTGGFKGTADFDPGTGTQQLVSAGAWGIFQLKLVQAAPPVHTLPASQTTVQGTPLVFSAAAGSQISLADPDAGSSPLRVTLSATNGSVTLASPAGLTFSQGDGSADTTMTFTGTLPAVNAALNGMSFVPAANFIGTAVLQLTTQDLVGPSGGQSDTDTLSITVTRRNGAPSAQHDAYTVLAQTTLTVAAPGLLTNDTDADSWPASLMAAVLAGPAHGALTLQPDGRFTYTPQTGYAGTDTFTYRAFDGADWSAPATVTVTVTPAQCTPRPQIRVGPATGDGRLTVHIEPTPPNGQQPNALQQLRFGTTQNATVTLNGQTVVSGQTVTLPPSTQAVDLTVERQNGAQATTVPFTVVDGCGSWQTFVGAGAGAGF
jgi:VCBS repeat-containing protein